VAASSFPEILKCGAESLIQLTYYIALLQGCGEQKRLIEI